MRLEVTRVPGESTREWAFRAVLLAFPLGLTFVVYHSLLGAYFFADDWVSLEPLVNEPVRFILWPIGGQILVVRNFIFYLLFQLFGPNPAPYFGVVLLAHLVNVALLFALIHRLSGPGLATLGATLWGVARVNEGTLGWISQHGHVFITTLVLLVLLDMTNIARMAGPVSPMRTLAWSATLLLVACTFGMGLGVAGVFPLAVWMMFRGRLSLLALSPVAFLPVARRLRLRGRSLALHHDVRRVLREQHDGRRRAGIRPSERRRNGAAPSRRRSEPLPPRSLRGAAELAQHLELRDGRRRRSFVRPRRDDHPE